MDFQISKYYVHRINKSNGKNCKSVVYTTTFLRKNDSKRMPMKRSIGHIIHSIPMRIPFKWTWCLHFRSLTTLFHFNSSARFNSLPLLLVLLFLLTLCLLQFYVNICMLCLSCSISHHLVSTNYIRLTIVYALLFAHSFGRLFVCLHKENHIVNVTQFVMQ